jgi:outer membrane protein assembly factor BamD (BamD/ComL family)
MKWFFYLILLIAMGAGWFMFSKSTRELAVLNTRITQLEDQGDLNDELPKLNSQYQSKDGEKTFEGILLTFLTAGVVGIFIVVFLLPLIVQRMTNAVYDSGEMVEKDVMHEARVKLAQGDYEGAIVSFRAAAVTDPLNRLPWIEIAKIQKDHLADSPAAISTIRYALETHAWEVDDAAFFMFRLSELYDQEVGDRASALSVMQQVIEQFPNSRHSANASHKIHEWNLQANETAATADA